MPVRESTDTDYSTTSGVPGHAYQTKNSMKPSTDGSKKADDKTSVSDDLEADNHQYDAITENRAGTTASVMYHNITAMVGAGLLGLPATMAYLGWAGGVITLVLSLLISWYTFYVLVILHEEEVEGKPIKRYNHYQDLCCAAFGRKKGLWALMPFQIALLYGISITYTVTGARNLMSFYNLQGATGLGVGPWVLIFSGCQIFLSQIPNFSALGWVSCVGALMSALYALLGIILPATYPNERSAVSYTPLGDSMSLKFFGVLNALTTVAFAYGGHNIALEIQGTIPAGPYESTIPKMMLGMNVTFVFTAIAYFGVAFAGFAAFGTAVRDNVLDSIGQPGWAISMAHLAVVLHVLASYQVYSFTLFHMIETGVAKFITIEGPGFKRTMTRVVVRTLYVCSTAFIACLIPFFGDLMGLIGAIGVTPTTFVIPPILWLVVKRPSIRSWQFWANSLIIFVMSLVGLLGSVAAVRTIVVHASRYEVFSGFGGSK